MNWYRADFEAAINGEKHYPDPQYYMARTDDEAIQVGKDYANEGIDYADVGHVDLELSSVTLVDNENEFNDIKTIYF